MTSYPDFICVGAQKAATTWLYDVLSMVPGVFLPRIKELHYFSELYAVDAKQFGPTHRTEQIRQSRKAHKARSTGTDYERAILAQLDQIDSTPINDEWYKGIFDFAHDNDICGEICPCYMSIPTRGVRHALSINPNLRVLIIVRDPIDRIWSHMRMHIKTGHLKFNLEHILNGQISLGPYMIYTNYKDSIRRWQSLCGHGRLKLLRYEGIREDPEKVLSEILKFVGLPDATTRADLTKIIFSGKPLDIPIELRAKLLEDLEPQYDFLRSIFPDDVERWLGSHHAALGLDQCSSPQTDSAEFVT